MLNSDLTSFQMTQNSFHFTTCHPQERGTLEDYYRQGLHAQKMVAELESEDPKFQAFMSERMSDACPHEEGADTNNQFQSTPG